MSADSTALSFPVMSLRSTAKESTKPQIHRAIGYGYSRFYNHEMGQPALWANLEGVLRLTLRPR
jgi:hypothetical protein